MASGHNWEFIRKLYEQGSTAIEISRRMGGKPSANVIGRRIATESWQQLPTRINTDPRSKDGPERRLAKIGRAHV
jgi:hypothetical protein